MGPVDGEHTGCKDGFGEGNKGKPSEMSNLCVKGGVSSNSEVEMTLAGGDHLLFPENERNSSGHDDTETVSERVVSESNHSKEFPNNTRARGERGDNEEKDGAGVEAATNVETRINGQGDIVEEREDKEINDESSSNLEGSCSAEEEGSGDVEEQEDSVRNILDKYLPLLERSGAETTRIEGDCGEMVTDKEYKCVEKPVEAEEGDETMEDGEDNGDKKTARGSIEMVREGGNFGDPPLEERSKPDCETGNMGEERGNPGGNSNGNLGGGILAKLIFGNFDSKGRY